jgi:hypothetical protein
MRSRKPPLPQCIAWVPARHEPLSALPFVPSHRCNYAAHAFETTLVPVCKVHARIRKPRSPRRDPRQIEAFASHGKESHVPF